MGRQEEPGRAHRGAHRAEPERSGPLATVGYVLGSTVPKRVEPPRLLSVLVVSGVALGLLLFAYSTTQIYLRFSEPPMDQESAPQPGSSGALRPSEAPSGQGTESDGGATSQSGDDGSPAGPGTVAYRTVETSDTGFTGQVTLTNTSENPMQGWELTLGFDDAEVTSAWDVEWDSTENGVTARQPESATALEPGESATVNFTAEGAAQTPAECALNGHTCSL